MRERKNNKGFTLVELIVVMAIMAILVGALAPQVVKYVEKARVSKDLQVENTLFTAVQTAISSSESAPSSLTNASLVTSATTGMDATLLASIQEILGADIDTDTEIIGKCVSSKVSATATVDIDYNATTGVLSVKIGNLDAVTN